MKELVKGNLKIIETKAVAYGMVFNNYIMKRKNRNGIWRKYKTGNLGNRTLEEVLNNEYEREVNV